QQLASRVRSPRSVRALPRSSRRLWSPNGCREGLDLPERIQGQTRVPFTRRTEMFRIVLSILVLASLVAVHVPPAAAQTAPARTAAKPAVTGQVNINTASAADLDALPGIGAKTAALIVEYRQKNGPFKKVEELMNVRGIGEKNFLKLKPHLTVGTSKAEQNQQP